MTALLAVDVGGTTVKAALVGRAGAVLQTWSRPTARGDEAVQGIVDLAIEVIGAAAARGETVVAAGIVTPGTVDAEAGVVGYASNLDWVDVPLRDRVSECIHVPVALGHDVQAAGEAEARLGAARGSRHFVHVGIGTGIAAALVVDGRPVKGSAGGAGELGHVPVRDAGEQCPCGQLGCLEVYASAAGLARRYERLSGRPATAPEIQAALGQDPVADRVWSDGVAALVRGLAITALLLEPELVVLGGGLAQAGDDLLDPVVAGLAESLVWRTPPEVRLSELGPGAAVLGAALLAAETAGLAEQVITWRP